MKKKLFVLLVVLVLLLSSAIPVLAGPGGGGGQLPPIALTALRSSIPICLQCDLCMCDNIVMLR
ncbi:MAG: hypothetical protein FWC73_02980 [Defluviitaleaceae bacterium]|nr:hypothetical protein [Defluviitaleaceae bacterium]